MLFFPSPPEHRVSTAPSNPYLCAARAYYEENNFTSLLENSHPAIACPSHCVEYEDCGNCVQGYGSHGGVPGCVWSTRMRQVGGRIEK